MGINSTGGQWQTSDGNKFGSMGEAQTHEDNINSGKNWSTSTVTKYRTPDGSEFYSEADAQARLRQVAEQEARCQKILDQALAQNSAERQRIMKPADDVAELQKKGKACYERKDWDGAITAYTKAIDILTGKQWKEYEKELRNFISGDSLEKNNYFERIQWLVPEFKMRLFSALAHRSDEKDDAGDFDGAISDSMTAVNIYPYNDENFIIRLFILGSCYNHRGNNHMNNKDFDRAVADNSVAVKLQLSTGKKPEEIMGTIESLYTAYFHRGNFFYDKLFTPQHTDEDFKQAYLDFKISLNFDWPDKIKETIDGCCAKLLEAKPQFANLQPQEDSSVQKVFAEISKSPGSSMPRAITVSNDAPPKTNASSSSSPSGSSAPASSAPAPQPQKSGSTVDLQAEENSNDPDNLCDLAFRYLEGAFGVPKDKQKAIQLFEKAAKLGSTHAQKQLKKLQGGLLGLFGKKK